MNDNNNNSESNDSFFLGRCRRLRCRRLHCRHPPWRRIHRHRHRNRRPPPKWVNAAARIRRSCNRQITFHTCCSLHLASAVFSCVHDSSDSFQAAIQAAIFDCLLAVVDRLGRLFVSTTDAPLRLLLRSRFGSLSDSSADTHTHTHTHTQRQINIRAWFFGFFLVRFVEHLLRWLFVTVIQISNHSSRLIQPFKVITGFLWDFPGIFPEFFLENFLEIFQYCSGVFFRIFLGFFGDFRGIFPYQFPILFPFQLTCFSIFFSWLFRNLFQDFSRIFRDFLGISQRFFRDFSGIFPYQLPILFLFLTKNFQQFFFQDYSKFITRFFLEFPNHFPWNFPAFSGFFWGCFFGNFFPEIFSELFQEFRPGFLEDCGPL